VCVADCTLAAALQFGRFGQLPLPDGYPRLAAWDQRYRARAPARSVLSL
jgi:glutathione S-transferase